MAILKPGARCLIIGAPGYEENIGKECIAKGEVLGREPHAKYGTWWRIQPLSPVLHYGGWNPPFRDTSEGMLPRALLMPIDPDSHEHDEEKEKEYEYVQGR